MAGPRALPVYPPCLVLYVMNSAGPESTDARELLTEMSNGDK